MLGRISSEVWKLRHPVFQTLETGAFVFPDMILPTMEKTGRNGGGIGY
jgi:hypothetical protein